MSRVTPERKVAFAVLRRTFEEDEHTEAAFREEAARAGIDGRIRAQAQRLAFGAVQRKGTTDWVVASFMKQKGRRSGLESSNSSTPTAPRTTPRLIRRSAWSGSQEPITPPDSAMRCSGGRSASGIPCWSGFAGNRPLRKQRSRIRSPTGSPASGGKNWGRTARGRSWRPRTDPPRRPSGSIPPD